MEGYLQLRQEIKKILDKRGWCKGTKAQRHKGAKAQRCKGAKAQRRKDARGFKILIN
jgi:hypothetical protein